MDERGDDTLLDGRASFPARRHGIDPEPVDEAMRLCGVTKDINIGCGFNIVSMWHPLRLAEDYAVADILTGGRIIFGVGRGYHTREVETFGAPLIEQNANREMFEEGCSRHSRGSRSRTRASTTRSHRRCRIAAIP
jgi:alkanesulfonate monooxygenase SsuD/methylene tetrahydromethanopterin reductase-like flavin-dependent oxidoreductase (luciferase family)